ncbi:4Fe-4S dicluster domain-containing protein [Rhodovastum atsumiense]|uniref:4Fe-4S dicluster domain-containing protein n=1 Tax=Rhodovastum atsumiense TaxID=504468 RepID=UPI00193B3B64|nr:4Fe-4S dicluster domain-containing protein [Rhodovastum atsumiense]
MAQRRRVLGLMAASMALAGCDPGGEDRALLPPVRQPPGIQPGGVNRYASVLTAGGEASGVVVTHRSGRPVKIEGNPNHPASLGATDAVGQAAILDLYDPWRAASLSRQGVPQAEGVLLEALAALRTGFAADHGAGLRLLTGSVVSPSLARAIDAVLAAWPGARWHQWDGIPRDNVLHGAMLAYGQPVAVVPRLEAAGLVLGLDSDLLETAPGHLRHARFLAAGRNPTRADTRNRIYAAEATPTLLGVRGDHRHPAGPQEMHRIVMGLAASVLRNERPEGWIAAVTGDLKAHPGRALVHAGPDLPAEAQALVHAVNEALGGRGRTFEVIDPPQRDPVLQEDSLRALVADMADGRVRVLVILGSNPVFTAPASLGFAAALARVPSSLALASAPDETTDAVTWFVPAVHELEDWGDALAFDGTAAIAQPQLLPLQGGRSPFELLPLLYGFTAGDARAWVRDTWRDRLDDTAWREALSRGVVPGSAAPALPVALRAEAATLAPPAPPSGLALRIRPDSHLGDGRHAGNAWLQEAPRPLTRVAWETPVLISPQIAARERLANGDVVRLACGTATVTAPCWIMPGQAAEVVVAVAGGGRWQAGPVGTGVGSDVTPLRGQSGVVGLRRTGDHVAIACGTRADGGLELSRDVAKRMAAAQQQPKPSPQPSLYPPRSGGGAVQWGMSIDLNACIGCNACVIACQAENNVPVVGCEEMLRHREMHWLRIDHYDEGPVETPRTMLQPMLCQHCEQAPCEIVCPVNATVHDAEGLNLQVYNRCVGTRFCSNNCPYKVRRFNFGAYAREESRPPATRNPEVSVRGRGVMEKCSFCLQRIAEARVAADTAGPAAAEAGVVTACQAACPTRAFSFGNVADPDSEVSRRKAAPLSYAALEKLSTSPRVSYEARLDNPNPALDQDD